MRKKALTHTALPLSWKVVGNWNVFEDAFFKSETENADSVVWHTYL